MPVPGGRWNSPTGVFARIISALSVAAELRIDLAAQQLILPDGRSVKFPIDTFSKQCMLDGYDQLGYLLNQTESIATYETRTGK